MIKVLKRKKSIQIYEYIKKIEEKYRLKNVFNPSYYHYKDFDFIAFRAFVEKKPFISFLAIFNKNHEMEFINLTEYVNQFNISIVADPKIFEFNKNLYITFNTGWEKYGNNIYIMMISPNLSKPLKCYYPDRQRIEKNWGFFGRDNTLYALYSISPLIVLKQNLIDKDGYHFKKVYEDSESTISDKSMTIGTQPVYRNNYLILVLHKKINIKKKRMYFGLLGKIEIKDNNIFSLRIDKKYLVHDIRSILGNKMKHNKNLLSCTYFSGIYIMNNKVILGYGINDLDYNIVEIEYAY